VATEVDRQVRAEVDACAKVADLYPPRCPFQAPGVVALATNVHWAILDYPHLALSPGDPSTDGAVAVVGTVVKGHARATYAQRNTTYTLDAEIDVRGAATVDNAGKVTFSR
jgi:hypothetical protein